EIAGDGVDHRLRDLGAAGAIEKGGVMTVDGLGQRRELGTGPGEVELCGDLSFGCWHNLSSNDLTTEAQRTTEEKLRISACGADKVGQHSIGCGLDAWIHLGDRQPGQDVGFKMDDRRRARDPSQGISKRNFFGADTGSHNGPLASGAAYELIRI